MGGLAETTRKPAAERLPGVETVHIADSGLVGDIIRAGEIPPRRAAPAVYRFGSAAAGADAIVCACSSVGAITEMASVLASVESAIGPTTDCIRRAASRAC